MRLILILDADPPTLQAMQDILTEEGYPCATSSEGTAGLMILNDRHPAIAFVDDELRDMTVIEFLKRKAAVPAIAAIPVIVTSANYRVPMLDGAVAMLRKPFKLDELLRAVREHLSPDPDPAAA